MYVLRGTGNGCVEGDKEWLCQRELGMFVREKLLYSIIHNDYVVPSGRE